MNTYVFKTSISQQDIRFVNTILRTLIPKSRWSFDLEDHDRILRVESKEDIVDLICFHLRVDGFFCMELE